MKAAVMAYGVNSYSRSQLLMCVSGSTANVNATSADAVLAVDSTGVSVGLTTGEDVTSTMTVRGDIELSDATFQQSYAVRWSSKSGNGRYTIAKIAAIERGGYNGDLAMYTRPNNSVVAQEPVERLRILHNGNVGINTANPSYKLQVNGSFYSTSLVSGSKSFLIDHPDPAKPTYKLRHRCVETNSAGSILYKYQVTCVKGANVVDLPSYFEHLAENAICVCSPFGHFGNSWAEISGNTATLHTSKAGVYNLIVMADRKDELAKAEFAEFPNEYIEEPEDPEMVLSETEGEETAEM